MLIIFFLSVGNTGTLLKSSDGTTWISKFSGESSVGLNGVCYGNIIFVIVGDGGAIRTSSDGNTWTQRTSGTSNNLKGVI